MNTIAILLSLFISFCFYCYIYSQNKQQQLEPFYDSPTVTPNIQEAKDLIIKHEVDYNTNIYNTDYLFNAYGSKIKTTNQLSFWTPFLDSGMYSIGTPVGKGLTSNPENKYTAVAGGEVINPLDYIQIYMHGRSKQIIQDEITKITSENKTQSSEIKKQLELLEREDKEGIFSIWKPVAPKGYKAMGYILTPNNYKPMLSDVKCIPERCTREVRKWESKDIVFVLETDGKRLTMYRNPILMTLFATLEKRSGNKWIAEDNMGLDEMPIMRLYPCLAKCDYVDKLIDADKCAKNMCINRKKDLAAVPLHSSTADVEEEKILLNEIKEQEEYMQKLKESIANLEQNTNKFNIVQKEYNRHEFENYLKNQGLLHKNTINKLSKSDKSVAVNINSPGGIKTLKQMLMDYLKYHASVLQTQNNKIKDAGTRQLPPGCTNWTDFKKTHRCKYSAPPCFGCVNPT